MMGMIDAIATTAMGAAFEDAQFTQQLVVVGKRDASTIEVRQRFDVCLIA
jgi:hypothetical protein